MDGFRVRHPLLMGVLCATMLNVLGCANTIESRHSSLVRNTIPASKFPEQLVERRRNHLVPIDLTLLEQVMPEEHIIGSQDILGISIENILEQEGELPEVHFASEQNLQSRTPTAGHPIRVDSDGTINLPYVDPVPVGGMSLSDATAAIRKAYLEASLLRRERDRIAVNLIQPDTHHVVVIREDAPGPTRLIHRNVQVLAQQGSGTAIDLPAFQNDVLHALTETGGLPGADTFNEVWVFRRGYNQDPDGARIMGMLQAGEDPAILLDGECCSEYCLRIPLRVPIGYVPAFTPEDIILRDGDVVYVTSRYEEEYFIGAGLLNGGKYILPRDRDTDIFDAIAIASSSSLGPPGNNAPATNFRRGTGNIIAPTRVVVVRKLSSGEQVKIRVNLRAAANDPKERILIQPGDIVMLKYTPSELMGNMALNAVTLNYLIPNR